MTEGDRRHAVVNGAHESRHDKMELAFTRLEGEVGGKFDVIMLKLAHLEESLSDRYANIVASVSQLQDRESRTQQDVGDVARTLRDARAFGKGAVLGWVLAGGFGAGFLIEVLRQGGG